MPKRNLKKLRDALLMANTPNNHEALADELSRLSQYEEAITHYEQALTGIYHDKPELLLKLAEAKFHAKYYLDCQKTLDYLIKQNPSFRSSEGHLLYARAVQMVDDSIKAEEEYKTLITYYSGPQARFYYAHLLYDEKRMAEAKIQLEEIIGYSKMMPKYYRNKHADCLSEAKKLLHMLPI